MTFSLRHRKYADRFRILIALITIRSGVHVDVANELSGPLLDIKLPKVSCHRQ